VEAVVLLIHEGGTQDRDDPFTSAIEGRIQLTE
jgi:hypothetical protein